MNHGKMTELPSQQAWREKVTLCIIIAGMMCCMGFMTFGLKPALCPDDGQDVYTHTFFDPKDHTSVLYNDDVVVFGNIYSFSDMSTLLASTILVNLTADWHGQDLTQLFKPATDLCSDYIKIDPALCSVPNPFPLSLPLQPAKGMPCPSISILSALRPKGRLAFDLSEVISHTAPPHILTAFNGHVLNLTQYFARNKFLSNYTSIETELEYIVGKDGTYGMAQSRDRLKAVMCLQQLYMVGYVQQPTAGCAASFAIVTIVSIIVVGTVMARLVIALMFHCFLSKKMTSKYATSKRGRSQIPDQDKEPYVICMIPCYSEGREGIGGTLESLCNAKYPNAKKLFFLIADGIICGQGNEKPTSEICKELFTIDPELTVEPKSYESNAVGKKKHNMAQVYAGKYKDVPTILVVKCGNKDECEQARQSDIGKVKPGNRGKRDSQLILMKFLSRLEFKDRLTELDYDMYSKIQAVATSPFKYEIILMVDADTVVDSACLGHMIDAMNADPHVMGLCGETQISNKSASWVTSIQVFEYYISHHLGKAFESVFGVVTCLPGCFCMYRIRYRGEAQPVPLIINNHIVSEYAADDVDTLHRKNLLLLGEDRFLTTLLLRMFPKKKMIFVPEATCSTEVPDNFKTLLSQRRRWINSTIHNLFVLMGVKDLCGIFCFSMQFVIALELVGTLILPAAICFAIFLILSAMFSGKADPTPLILLAVTLILPGVVIIVTVRQFEYLMWLGIYILALPIWNFVLPMYAFWHFDDFSWGETRKVNGDTTGGDHSNSGSGMHDPTNIPSRT
ncbi:chitin synthase [Polychytrium aggregatum]|uniref:chitin synthase n=1 Tax=Polychytrium aggregatum TaxID=110093 RepID=UPI0022FF16CD|nr:chitin synthase [Polychytrium aggregatum]KAI9204203.1 chitin synthase [Polychytrium aggregatum]